MPELGFAKIGLIMNILGNMRRLRGSRSTITRRCHRYRASKPYQRDIPHFNFAQCIVCNVQNDQHQRVP